MTGIFRRIFNKFVGRRRSRVRKKSSKTNKTSSSKCDTTEEQPIPVESKSQTNTKSNKKVQFMCQCPEKDKQRILNEVVIKYCTCNKQIDNTTPPLPKQPSREILERTKRRPKKRAPSRYEIAPKPKRSKKKSKRIRRKVVRVQTPDGVYNPRPREHPKWRRKISKKSRNPFINYLLFLKENEDFSSMNQLMTEAGKRWRELDDDDKYDFYQAAETVPKPGYTEPYYALGEHRLGPSLRKNLAKFKQMFDDAVNQNVEKYAHMYQ